MQHGATLLVLVLAVCGAAVAVRRPPGFDMFRRWDRRPPTPRGDAGNITQHVLEQKLEHYDPTNTATWKQRYWVNGNFYRPGGPMFLMIGGEAEEDGSWTTGGQMADLAHEFGAMVFDLEHRFYGKSLPTEDASTENLRYLRVDNALADLAFFIQEMNEHYGLQDSPWIVFGGSYPGNLAAWARLKFPHLVHGAVASSAPVRTVTNFTGYFEVVGQVMNSTNPQCYKDVQNATSELQELIKTEEGAQQVTQLFNLCQTLNISNADDVHNLQNILATTFAFSVQYATVEEDELGSLCEQATNPEYGDTPLIRYANISYTGGCFDVRFSTFVDLLANTSWELVGMTFRPWYYQMCAELGFFESSDSPNQPFGDGFPVQYYLDWCTSLFSDQFTPQLIEEAVERTNMLYGADHPVVSNVVFVNGGADPWHVQGVLEDLSQEAPAIVIEGTSHCADMYETSPSDPPQLTEAREKIKALVKKWLS